jgi:hypothetical protein
MCHPLRNKPEDIRKCHDQNIEHYTSTPTYQQPKEQIPEHDLALIFLNEIWFVVEIVIPDIVGDYNRDRQANTHDCYDEEISDAPKDQPPPLVIFFGVHFGRE